MMAAPAAEIRRGRPVCIGIDLDNTIIDYRESFSEVAASLCLVPDGFSGDKAALRACVRALPDGEHRWIELQAEVYGARILTAREMPGALDFVRRAVAAAVPVFIVSHKTQYPAADPQGIDLRAAAREWLARHGFIADDALSPSSVFFEGTRADKVARIGALGCTAFIDDLVEVFDDVGFPPGLENFLLATSAAPTGAFHVVSSWYQIEAALLIGPYLDG